MKEGNGRRRDGEDFELEFEVIECDGDFVVFLGDRVPKWPHVDKLVGTLQMYMLISLPRPQSVFLRRL